MTLAEAKERIRRLEEFVGEARVGEARSLTAVVAAQSEEVAQLRQSLAESSQDMAERTDRRLAEANGQVAELRVEMQTLKEELLSLRQGMAHPARSGDRTHPKLKIPEPKPYNGKRDAKELDNFVWDLEQYFRAFKVPEVEQVNLASMFLSGDAKLWWRTRMSDDQAASRPNITTWPVMKRELQAQFLPHNTAWIAREALKKLRHTGSVREFVKAFSSLLLDIHNMSEEDKLFNFMSGLQPWAQTELRRQGVKDLPTAMAAAEGLVDFRSASPMPPGDRKVTVVAKESLLPGDKKKKKVVLKKKAAKVVAIEPAKQVKPGGCFICGGPHRARDCSKKEKVSALTSYEDETDSAEEEEIARVNPLQLLNAITVKEPSKDRKLMHIPILLNGKKVKAMLDTGATNNFISQKKAKELELAVSRSTNLIKAVNSRAVHVHGLAEVMITAGSWEGNCSLIVIPLDDFDVILGLEFFMAAKVMIIPYLHGIFIGKKKSPCFVPVEGSPKCLGRRGPRAATQAVAHGATGVTAEQSTKIGLDGSAARPGIGIPGVQEARQGKAVALPRKGAKRLAQSEPAEGAQEAYRKQPRAGAQEVHHRDPNKDAQEVHPNKPQGGVQRRRQGVLNGDAQEVRHKSQQKGV